MERVCELACRAEKNTGNESSEATAAGQEVSLGQACPQGCTSVEGRAEKEGMQEPPETHYLLEKALGEGLGGHQS